MNYEITGSRLPELANVKTDTSAFLLLIFSILFIPGAYAFALALFVKELFKKHTSVKLNKYYALLYAYMAIGLIFSKYKLISLFFTLLMILCIYTFNTVSTLSENDLLKIRKYILVLSSIAFLYGIVQYINPNFFLPLKWVDKTEYNLNKRVYSTFFNPNILGFYANFIILLTCGNLDDKKINLETVTFLGAAICLVLTFSRTSWFSLIISLLIAGFLDKKYFKYCLIVFIFIYSSDFMLKTGRSDPIKAISDSSVIYRFEIWKASLKIIKEHFIWGIGFGTLFKYISSYSETVSANIEHCHNIYLQVFTETGVLGFCIFTYFISKIYKGLSAKLKENRSLWITAFSVFTMTMIHGLADSVALTPQIMMILSIYAAWAVKKKRSPADI